MPIHPIDGKTSNPPPPPPPPPNSAAPAPIQWQAPTPFPEGAAPVLRKTRIRKSQFPKAVQELALFLFTNLGPDYAIAMQDKLRRGDKDAMKQFAEVIGLLKNASPVQVNLQTNLNVQTGGGMRQVDNLVRMLDERDRTKVIDQAPVAGEDKEFDEDEGEDE